MKTNLQTKKLATNFSVLTTKNYLAMKNVLFVFIAFLFFTTTTHAQKDETLFNQTGIRLTGVWGGPSYDVSRIGDENIVHRGGQFGFEFNKSILVGWRNVNLEDQITFEEGSRVTDLDYNTFMLGYAMKPHRVFHPQFMLAAGAGDINIAGEGRDRVVVIEPSAGVEINVFRWFRIGLNGGYRIFTGTDFANLNDGDLSRPYGEIKFKFGWSWGR